MKFNIIVGDRQSGKTMSLIHEAAKRGTTIVCPTKQQAEFVLSRMKDLGIKAPEPKSFYELSPEDSYKEFSIDNLDQLILQILHSRCPKIVTATMTEPFSDSCEQMAVYLTKKEKDELQAYRDLGSLEYIRDRLNECDG